MMERVRRMRVGMCWMRRRKITVLRRVPELKQKMRRKIKFSKKKKKKQLLWMLLQGISKKMIAILLAKLKIKKKIRNVQLRNKKFQKIKSKLLLELLLSSSNSQQKPQSLIAKKKKIIQNQLIPLKTHNQLPRNKTIRPQKTQNSRTKLLCTTMKRLQSKN